MSVFFRTIGFTVALLGFTDSVRVLVEIPPSKREL